MKTLVLVFCFAAAAQGHFLPAQGGRPYTWEEDRIIGGNVTTIEAFPYQISLERSGSHICGGSIIDEKWVLTAAHCVLGITDNSYYKVRAGTAKRGEGGVLVAVEKHMYHPQFTMNSLDYDVALLKLATPLTLAANIKAVKLNSVGQEVKQGETVIVSGWGTLQSGSPSLPTTLNFVRVPAISRRLCNLAYSEIRKISERMICAGISGKDSCQGDSGGPLVNEDHVQVGIVSWGRGCALSGFPGVYTNVANTEIQEYIKTNILT